jgi:N-acetylglucosamine repressor
MRRNSIQTSSLGSDILKRVRSQEGISRVELARDLGLAPSTAGIYVERLLAEGYLIETDAEARDAGRPPRILRPNPEGGEFIGVDFESRNIMAVAMDFSDKPLRNAHRSIDPKDSVGTVVAKLEEAIAEVLPQNPKRLLAIGVGVPGIVDASRGVAVHYKYIAKWKDVPLVAKLGARFKVPVFLENNARTMALAELWFGQGRGLSDFVCLGIRSGIGAGIVLNGRLQSGVHCGAGELGRWRGWAGDGPELQEVASARAIQETLSKLAAAGKKTVLQPGPAGLAFSDVVVAAQQRDALTLQTIQNAAELLGQAIGQIALLLDPAKIILAGPLGQLGETFLAPVRAAAAKSVGMSGVQPPEINNSGMGEFSGALGAAALALHEWKPSSGFMPKTEPGARGKKARGRRV